MADKEEYYAFGTFKLPKGYKKITEYIITRDMTAKEKANELMERFSDLGLLAGKYLDDEFHKECALIVIHEVMQCCGVDEWFYWDEVKKEIEAI
jgi:hypothetical protein